ncbi:MAG: methyltransferase [Vampirovibrionales bacterium]|nr:methyltransferase [Vampirovibrionales bacterium]
MANNGAPDTLNKTDKTLNSDRIQDALYGFTRSQILFSALDLQIFTAIAKTRLNRQNNTQGLVASLGQGGQYVSQRGIALLLDGLVGMGFITKDADGCYDLPSDIAEFLVEDKPHYLGGMVTHCKRLYENWGMLTDAVRAGQPVGGAQSLTQLETYFSELVKGLYVSNYPTAKQLAKALKVGVERKGQHILDVAGGSGVWSIALLEADATSEATLLDFPTVVEVAEEFVTQHKLQDRYHYWPEDLEVADFPENKFDMAVLGNICHALGAYSTEKLIAQMYKTLKPGGEIVIVDFVPDDARAKPGWPLIFAVNMLVSTPEGNVFSAGEYRTWFEAAGFSKFETRALDSEVTVLIGVK